MPAPGNITEVLVLKFRFLRPRCTGRDCYVDNRDIYAIKKAFGRKIFPGERYCIFDKVIRRFKKCDAAVYTPKWCPRFYGNYKVNIYAKKPNDALGYLMDKHFGEDYIARVNTRNYELCTTTTTAYTPLQFSRKLSSGLCDYAELLGREPRKYDVIEIDNGLTSAYLYLNKNYDWVQIFSFRD